MHAIHGIQYKRVNEVGFKTETIEYEVLIWSNKKVSKISESQWSSEGSMDNLVV